MAATGYPKDNIIFIKGKVEQTIPGTLPGKIALLRLDTDWYESTKHELNHLYPLLEKAGILIIDDYGAWQGARKAVDEYFSTNGPVYLHRLDFTGRLVIKERLPSSKVGILFQNKNAGYLFWDWSFNSCSTNTFAVSLTIL